MALDGREREESWAASEGMREFLAEHWLGSLIVVSAIVFIINFIEYLCRSSDEHDKALDAKIASMGYKDKVDVRFFLRSLGYNRNDFIKSSGLRKQYELFHEGHVSEYVGARKTKMAKDKASSDASDNLLMGVAVGSMISSSNHSA